MSQRTVRVGVLALQGAFAEHIRALERAAAQPGCCCGGGGGAAVSSPGSPDPFVTVHVSDVRTPEQLAELDGLIIPGGESTTLGVFLRQNGFEGALREWIRRSEKPGVVWGTCAGLILLSEEITGQKRGGQASLGGLSVECCRNAYGRQSSSFEAPIKLTDPTLIGMGTSPHQDEFHGVFIRAPGIVRLLEPAQVRVLARLVDREQSIVAVQQDNLMATTFHPELTTDDRWHWYFINLVASFKYPD